MFKWVLITQGSFRTKQDSPSLLKEAYGSDIVQRTLNTPDTLVLPFVPIHGLHTAGHSAAFALACIKPAVQRVPYHGQQTLMQTRSTPITQSLPSRRVLVLCG